MSEAAPGLITLFGGSGFVGSQVVQDLARRGWRIRVAVRRPDRAYRLQTSGHVGQIQAVRCDAVDPAQVEAALRTAWSAASVADSSADSGSISSATAPAGSSGVPGSAGGLCPPATSSAGSGGAGPGAWAMAALLPLVAHRAWVRRAGAEDDLVPSAPAGSTDVSPD